MSKVLLAVSNGFEEIEAISVIDILRRANIEVIIAGIEDKILTGAHNLQILANTKIEDMSSKDFDMIVLPGGLPNAFTLAQNDKVQELLKDFKKEAKKIAAICAAPYALHKAGVLEENYTCYPSFEKQIKEQGYKENENVVIDKKVITSRGPATAMQFALELVKILKGEDVYKEVKGNLLA